MPTSRRRAAPSSASATPGDEGAAAAASGTRVLKKYPNRRLYDTVSSSYITLPDVKAMVLQGTAFVVHDAKTGDDITRSILLQIILEEETAGAPLFSTPMLANLIRFYGHAMQGMMGHYLEHHLQAFTDMQAQLAEQSQSLYSPSTFPTTFNAEAWSQWAKVFQNLPGFPGFPPVKR